MVLGLGDKKKQAARKKARKKKKEARKKARQDKREARKDARKEKQSARREARGKKKELRQETRGKKREARKEKREELRKIRKSDADRKEKKELKKEVRREAKNKKKDARTGKKQEKAEIRSEKKAKIQEAKAHKKETIAKAERAKDKSIKRAKEELGMTTASRGSAPKFVKTLWKRYAELAQQFKQGPKAYAAARIEAGMTKKYRQMQITKNLIDHPRELAFAGKSGNLISTFGKTWIHPAPYDRDQVKLVFKKVGGRGKASVLFCKYTRDGKSEPLWYFQIDSGKDNIGKTFRKSFDGVAGSILTVTVDGKSFINTFKYEVHLERPGQGKVLPPKKVNVGKVQGFADVHAHQFINLAFAGGYLWGDSIRGLRPCTGENHGRLLGQRTREWCGKHTDRTQVGDWPHHLDTIHQMMNWRHLYQAYKRGLRLLVVPVVNNMFLAHLVMKKDSSIPLNDMDNIRLQIKVAHAFAEKHKWYCIAHDPWEARQIIKGGKMAVILSVETSHLMPDTHGNWVDQLDELYNLGVRSMQIVHETDSRFAGAAFHHGNLFRVMHVIKNVSKSISDVVKANPLILTRTDALAAKAMYASVSTYSQKGPHRKLNPIGLSKEGRKLIMEMIKRRMIIEIDHCSRKARADIYKFLRRPNEPQFAYPVNFTHTRFDSLMPREDEVTKELGEVPYQHAPGYDSQETTGEYMPTDDEIRKMKKTGGIFGIRTGPNMIKKYRNCPVANTCHTSSRSLAQMISKGADMGLAMSLGTDLQGGAPAVGARFDGGGKQQNAGSGIDRRSDNESKDRFPPVKWNGKWSEFNYDGLKHAGLEPDLLQDLGNLGLNVDDLKDNSAEFFLRMWERCYKKKRVELGEAAYRSYFGVTIPPGARAT